MKKIAVITIILLISLSGCSTGKKSNDKIYKVLNKNSDWRCSEDICSSVELNGMGDPNIKFNLDTGYFYFKLFINENSWEFAVVYIYSEDKIELYDRTLIEGPVYTCTIDDDELNCDDNYVIDNYSTQIMLVINTINIDLS